MEIYIGFKNPHGGYCHRKLKGVIGEKEIMIEISGDLEKKIKKVFDAVFHQEKLQLKAQLVFSYAFRASLISSLVFGLTRFSKDQKAHAASCYITIAAFFISFVSLSTICVCDIRSRQMQKRLSDQLKQALMVASETDVEFYVAAFEKDQRGASFNSYEAMKKYIANDAV